MTHHLRVRRRALPKMFFARQRPTRDSREWGVVELLVPEPAGVAAEVLGKFGQVRNSQTGRLVVHRAGIAGVEDIVVRRSYLLERRERRVLGRRETVNRRVPEADSVSEGSVDHRGRTVQLWRYETRPAPSGFQLRSR